MPQSPDAAVDQADASDLISFFKAIPDGRYRRGVRYPQWFLLLVAVLGILSGCRSSRDLEAFAKRHRDALNQGLGQVFKPWPSDATFVYLSNKAQLHDFGQVLQAWLICQIPSGTDGLDQLVCDGNTLRGSAVETEVGQHRFVAQVTVYARALGAALAQRIYGTQDQRACCTQGAAKHAGSGGPGPPKSLSTAPLAGLSALALVGGSHRSQCPESIPPQPIRLFRLT